MFPKSSQLAILVVVASFGVSACQKAKMSAKPRATYTRGTGGGTHTNPPIIRTTPPTVIPPTVTQPPVLPPTVTQPPVVHTPPSVVPSTPSTEEDTIIVGPPIHTTPIHTQPVVVAPQPTIIQAGPPVVAPAPQFGEIRVIPGPGRDVLSSCGSKGLCPDAKPTVRAVQQPTPAPVVKPVPVPVKREDHQCSFEQRMDPITSKLDILFVLDSSQSLDAEREKIAREIGRFVNELDHYGNQVDYRIAVMLAHGPGSLVNILDSRAGRPIAKDMHATLFQTETSDDTVLISRRGDRDEGEALNLIQIHNQLLSKFANVRKARDTNDIAGERASTAQGEAGLLSLFTSLTNNKKLTDITLGKPNVFFRPDAALAVVFVADENDVCFDYNSTKAKALGIKPRWRNKQPGQQDPKEVHAFNTICKVGGQQLTSEMVYEALVNVKRDMPIIVSGIVYTDNNKIPKIGSKESKGASFEENEAGHGYLDLIRIAHGEAQDLGGDFGKKLASIGDLSAFRMQYINAFPILNSAGQPVESPNRIDSATLTVEIYDETGRNLVRSFKGLNEVTLEIRIADGVGGRDTANAVVNRNLLRDLVKPGQKVIIKWNYMSQTSTAAATQIQTDDSTVGGEEDSN